MFAESFTPTIGIDFKIKTLRVRDKTVKLQLWDTAGQERYRSMTKLYLRDCHFAVIVFDLTNPNSFDSVMNAWIDQVRAVRGQ